MASIPEESRKAALSKKQRSLNIPWTPEQMLALLKQVETNGAHLKKRGTVDSSTAWKSVNKSLFKEVCMAECQSSYEDDDPREVRDKYDSLMDSATDFKEAGISNNS